MPLSRRLRGDSLASLIEQAASIALHAGGNAAGTMALTVSESADLVGSRVMAEMARLHKADADRWKALFSHISGVIKAIGELAKSLSGR